MLFLLKTPIKLNRKRIIFSVIQIYNPEWYGCGLKDIQKLENGSCMFPQYTQTLIGLREIDVLSERFMK